MKQISTLEMMYDPIGGGKIDKRIRQNRKKKTIELSNSFNFF